MIIPKTYYLKTVLWSSLAVIALLKPVFGQEAFFNPEILKNEKLYDLLAVISHDSLHLQIRHMENFLRENPDNVMGSLWLMERYTSAGKLEKAKGFFESFSDTNVIRYWILAKISLKQENWDHAEQMFVAAYPVFRAQPDFLFDLFGFLKQRQNMSFENFLSISSLSHFDSQSALLLWRYINEDYEGVIESFEDLPNSTKRNTAYIYALGLSYLRSDQKNEAIATWTNGLRLSHLAGDLDQEIKFLTNLSTLAKTDTLTIKQLQAAYAIAQRIDKPHRIAQAAGNLGIIYSKRGAFSKAESLYQIAILQVEKVQDKKSMANWYPWIANLLVQQDRFDEALEKLDQGTKLASESNNEGALLHCQIREAELYRIIGEYELSRSLILKILKQLEGKNGHKYEVQTYMELAHLNLAAGRFTEAKKIYQQFLEKPPENFFEIEDHAWWSIQLGKCYLGENNFKDAKKSFQNSLFFSKSSNSAFFSALALLHLADIAIKTGDFSTAHACLDSCDVISRQTELQKVLPALYSLRGDAFRLTGKLNRAIATYLDAARLIEQLRAQLGSEDVRTEYFSKKLNIYDKLIECYRQPYAATEEFEYLQQIYAYLEMKRSRTLRELREDTSLDSGDGSLLPTETAAARRNLLAARDDIERKNWLLRRAGHRMENAQLDSALQDLQLSRLSLSAQQLRQRAGTPISLDTLLGRLPDLHSVQAKLKLENAAVLYFHLSGNPFALVVSADSTNFVDLPQIGDVKSDVEELLAPFYERKIERVVFQADVAYQLYQSLIEPVEQAVRLPDNLYFILDEAIRNLPVQLLIDASPDKASYNLFESAPYARSFLIEKYSIAYLPNAGFLWPNNKGAGSRKVVVYASPYDELYLPDTSRGSLGSRTLSHLVGPVFPPPFSGNEAEAIREILPAVQLFLNRDATTASFFENAKDAKIIHFATHAFADITDDMFCGVVLAMTSDSSDDGRLMGYELTELELTADLVCLSGCETGRGRIIRGEGILGLPRLFLAAGANSVVLTHWQIQDRFAADFMKGFYSAYLEDGLSKTAAITKAKRSALQHQPAAGEFNYAHPYFWAAFDLYGSPGSVRSDLSMFSKVVLGLVLVLISLSLLYFIYTKRTNRNKTFAKVVA